MFDRDGREIIGARMKRRTGAKGFKDLGDRELQRRLDGELCCADKPEILRYEQEHGTFDTCHHLVKVLADHYGVIVFIFTDVSESVEDEIVRLLEDGFQWTGYKVKVKKGELGPPGATTGDKVLMIELLEWVA